MALPHTHSRGSEWLGGFDGSKRFFALPEMVGLEHFLIPVIACIKMITLLAQQT